MLTDPIRGLFFQLGSLPVGIFLRTNPQSAPLGLVTVLSHRVFDKVLAHQKG